MYTVEKTDVYDDWFAGLKDLRAKAKIIQRIERLELGNPGQVNSVGEGISELKIDYGPGYRIYYKQTGKTIMLLLCGGDKTSQKSDIETAKALVAHLNKSKG